MALILRYAVRSDLGLVRGNNEDSVYAGPRLLAIADGMGGHAAGEVASKIAIGAMENLDEDRPFPDLAGSLRQAVLDGNSEIAEASEENKQLEGMGTTLTALRFSGSQVVLVHVGDSRAYLLRDGELSQITHDDTYVQYLVDSGKLTPEEAKDHPRKSVILRALNGVEVDPDISIREARPGDRYLLCSDGLSDVVSGETILDALQIADPQESADRLVELALRGGGPDNVTVIVADVVNAKVGDLIDDAPVVAGAFVDPTSAAPLPPDAGASAAERAAQITRQAAPPPPPEAGATQRAATSPRRRRRWPWITAGVIIVLAAALGGAYAWTQAQYFVSARGGRVAIFRGVDATFGPVKFFSVYRESDLRVAQLNPSAASQVHSGINANSESDAQKIVQNLRSQLRPGCAASATPTPSSGPTAPGSSTPGESRTDARTDSARPSHPAVPSRGSSTAGKTPVDGLTPVASQPSRLPAERSTAIAAGTPVGTSPSSTAASGASGVPCGR